METRGPKALGSAADQTLTKRVNDLDRFPAELNQGTRLSVSLCCYGWLLVTDFVSRILPLRLVREVRAGRWWKQRYQGFKCNNWRREIAEE